LAQMVPETITLERTCSRIWTNRAPPIEKQLLVLRDLARKVLVLWSKDKMMGSEAQQLTIKRKLKTSQCPWPNLAK